MVAKRHHIVPRFLLSAFADEDRAWLLRPDRPAVRTGVGNIAVEARFYGNEPSDRIEEALSQEERTHAAAIRRARERCSVAADDIATITRFLVLLAFRLKAMRNAVSDGITAISRKFGPELTSPERASELAMKLIDARPEFVYDFYRRRKRLSQDSHLSEEFRAFLVRKARDLVQSSGEEIARELRCLDPRALDEVAGRAHSHALWKLLGTDPTAVLWPTLSWAVLAREGLVLGDIGPLAAGAEGASAIGPLIDHAIDPALVVLPIAHNQILVGSRLGLSAPSVEDINRDVAGWSAEWIVARRFTDREAAYARLIGSRSRRPLAHLGQGLAELFCDVASGSEPSAPH